MVAVTEVVTAAATATREAVTVAAMAVEPCTAVAREAMAAAGGGNFGGGPLMVEVPRWQTGREGGRGRGCQPY